MQITEVRIRPANRGRVRARVSITIDHCFMISGLKVIRGPKGYFVEMPRRKQSDGTYLDFVAPINLETRRMIERAIFVEFEKVTGERVTTRVSKRK